MLPSKAPLVSGIMPAWNAAKYIRETLASIQSQSFRDWELVVADDGSSDATPDIVREIAAEDPRIRLILAGRTGKPAAARNRALEHARGRVICFWDADDLWEPDCLRSLLRALKRESAGWAFANVRHIGDGAGGNAYAADWRPSVPFYPELLTGDGVPCITIAVRRSLLAAVSPGGNIARAMDEVEDLVEDWDLALRLARRAQPAYIARPLATYRHHSGGISKTVDRNLERMLRVIEKQRREGAPEELCRKAILLQRSKHAAERMLRGDAEGWRGDLLRTTAALGLTPRNAYLGALALLPGSLARGMYRLGLAMKRR
jgi:teichuronic acid biosynthesis glycosyltransferase TuaG